ncbi:MAG: DUF2800 domain-containing protein [Pseudobutyrivibrio sp.]|nr:DUF2800 domain-containing protein [Pseudobutyrivibrio sp.]
MIWNRHFELEGSHAFLGASKYHWIFYDEDKIKSAYENHLRVLMGTELHELAARLIKFKQKLPDEQITFNMYVNDAIDFGLDPEVVLRYSDFCFGTADAINFQNGKLRIHDLKTGVTKAHIEQLQVYAALFCLEYHYKPADIDITLRLYQNNDIFECKPEVDDIAPIMDKIIVFDEILNNVRNSKEVY